jgi:hypothetical protein
MDQTLYGPEANEARGLLRDAVRRIMHQAWSQDPKNADQLRPDWASARLYASIQNLSPKDDFQRSLLSHASNASMEIGQSRFLLYEQRGNSISSVFLFVVIFWLTLIFVSFGMHAPPNGTLLITLFLAALSVSGAIFLTLELDTPFTGIIRIPTTPLENALTSIGS